MNNPKCPLCNSFDTKFDLKAKDYFMLNGNSPDFHVYCCETCKNSFTSPFMSNEELGKYYPDTYDCYKSHSKFSGFLQNLKSLNDVRIIKKTMHDKNKNILEIGSGSGMFLNLLKKEGYNVDGVEPSDSGVSYAKENYNLDLELAYFEDFEFKKKYDLIIMFHVLEHFNDPVSVLEKIKKNLNKDGILFIKVPRVDSWGAKIFRKYWSGYDLPRHRFHFSKNGLIGLLNKYSFHTILFKSDLYPLNTVRAINYYSMFSKNKVKKIIFKALNILPHIIKLCLAILFDIIMLPFKSGRMSIIVQKK
ncbi:MAG: methyltransferase domain-containing protein [Candidatus Delongbacteria bacterium]|nr:methyltransferase domain-containing protein [Candidatus Delongbacteria bacterium]